MVRNESNTKGSGECNKQTHNHTQMVRMRVTLQVLHQFAAWLFTAWLSGRKPRLLCQTTTSSPSLLLCSSPRLVPV